MRSNSYDYSHTYKLVKGTIKVPNTTATHAAVININEKVIFNTCALLTDLITEINNTQVDNNQKIDVVMSMFNLIEYSDTQNAFTCNQDEISSRDETKKCLFKLN